MFRIFEQTATLRGMVKTSNQDGTFSLGHPFAFLALSGSSECNPVEVVLRSSHTRRRRRDTGVRELDVREPGLSGIPALSLPLWSRAPGVADFRTTVWQTHR